MMNDQQQSVNRSPAEAEEAREANRQMPETGDHSQRQGGEVQGEGNYEAAKKFDADEAGFIKNNPEEIARKAREAAEALDGPEAEELVRAEAEGRSPAAH